MSSSIEQAVKRLFIGPKLKLERACRHIGEFEEALERFLQSDFYEAKIEQDDDQAYFFRVSMTRSIPAEFPLCTGDAVHNMRSSLDHVASGIVAAWRGHGKDVYFPFAETHEELVSRLKKHLLGQAYPQIIGYILDEIKPYKDGNTPLWQLNKLDNIDKHNLLIPAIYNTSVFVERLEADNGAIIEHSLISVGPGGLFQPFRIDSKLYNRGKIEPYFDVRFEQGGPFEERSILPTLIEAVNAVNDALAGLEKFLIEAGWPRSVT